MYRLAVWTRFNLPMVRHGDTYKNPEWIKRRLELYGRFTLPSLLHQEDRDFDILLDCAAGTERIILPLTEVIRDAGVTLLFDRGEEYYRSLPPRFDQVAFLRLDSDDMVAVRYVYRARKELDKGHRVQFARGYRWNIETNQLKPLNIRSSPFYGMVRPRERVKRVGDFWGHRLARKGGIAGHSRFRHVFRPHMIWSRRFVQISHGENIVFTARKSQPGGEDPNEVLPRFGVRRDDSGRVCSGILSSDDRSVSED